MPRVDTDYPLSERRERLYLLFDLLTFEMHAHRYSIGLGTVSKGFPSVPNSGVN